MPGIKSLDLVPIGSGGAPGRRVGKCRMVARGYHYIGRPSSGYSLEVTNNGFQIYVGNFLFLVAGLRSAGRIGQLAGYRHAQLSNRSRG